MFRAWNNILLFLGIKKLGCWYCLEIFHKDITFKTKQALFTHLEELHGVVHPDTKTPIVECPHCGGMIHKTLINSCPSKNNSLKLEVT